MMDEYGAYQRFARRFTDHFAARVIGLDPSLARIVNLRPADQVLGGFLTPVREDEDSDADGSIEDLPQDSAYEQTAMGLEWLIDQDALSSTSLAVSISLSVYARVMPTYEEQRAGQRWDRPRGRARQDLGQEAEAQIVPVWQRIDLKPVTLDIPLADMVSRRRLRIDISASLREHWQHVDLSALKLYPGGTRLSMRASEFTPAGFEQFVHQTLRATAPTPEWGADLDLRLSPFPTTPGFGRLSLRLINRTPWPGFQQLAFFDPNLYAVDISVSLPSQAHRAMTFRELEQSYRYDLALPAVGINCHADAEHQDGQLRLRTQPVPRKELGRLEPRQIEAARPTFEDLQKEPLPLLYRILDEMRAYDQNTWAAKVNELSGASRAEAQRDRRRFQKDEIQAFERGIKLLANPDYKPVLRAFILMNEAMGDVASWAGYPEELWAGRRSYTEWRLFQIVFIVCQIPMLAAREYSELEQGGDDAVDILWFAAGGGKTEAFLGLIIWQAFFDRLRGKRLGTAALVRFPLRLLAFQQLQRTARALAAAEVIRVRDGLGGARFSLGYYVGSTQTPNSITNDLHQRLRQRGLEPDERRITECPFCGAEIEARYDPSLRLIEHWCIASNCPGGAQRLPIYIVDRDVERYLPTVIVATVDKLAQFGQQQRFTNIFGRVSLVCGRHGASFRDIERSHCEAAKAFDERVTPETQLTRCGGAPVFYPPFHDLGPALLIQDELHLVSEELGTFDAHYETAIMELSRTLGYRPWKVIAATATIAGFEQHVNQLYLKPGRQFPAPGPEAYSSFYYELDAERTARIFIGVLGIGRKHTPAVTRALSLLYQELQHARDLARHDLAAACRHYNLPDLTSQQFTVLLFYYELALTYVLTRRGSDQVAEAIESRVKRELSELADEAGELRVETFNGSVDMGEMIEAMRQIERADPNLAPEERTRGLVATNIIGHGVDVDRFNIIVFAGFTRLVAEYIQASARVGRRYPGLSLFVATPQSERDRSVYERFTKFHEYLDRLVDPSAVNRWPTPALEKTMTGLLAGYLMGVAAAQMDRRLETIERVQAAIGDRDSEPLQEASLRAWMVTALGAQDRPEYRAKVETTASRLFSSIVNAETSSMRWGTLLNHALEPMRSLRDVDEPANIIVPGENAEVIKVLSRG